MLPDTVSALRRALISMSNLRKLVLMIDAGQLAPILEEFPEAFQLDTFVSPFYSSPEYFVFLYSQHSITDITFIGDYEDESITIFSQLSSDNDFLPNLEHVAGNYVFPLLLAPGRPLQHVNATWRENNPSLELLFSTLPQSSCPILSLSLGNTIHLDCPTGWELIENLRHTTIALSLQSLLVYESRAVRTSFLII